MYRWLQLEQVGSKQSLVAVQHSQYLLGTLAILLQSMIWIVTVKIAGQLN